MLAVPLGPADVQDGRSKIDLVHQLRYAQGVPPRTDTLLIARTSAMSGRPVTDICRR
jgi:hypothetical protein